LILQFLALVICTIPLHELGHYIFAKRFQFQEIKCKIWKWHKIPIGFMVTGKREMNNPTVQEVFKWHFQTNAFQVSGSLFSVLGYALCYLLEIFTFEFTALMSIFMLWYGIVEVTTPRGLKNE